MPDALPKRSGLAVQHSSDSYTNSHSYSNSHPQSHSVAHGALTTRDFTATWGRCRVATDKRTPSQDGGWATGSVVLTQTRVIARLFRAFHEVRKHRRGALAKGVRAFPLTIQEAAQSHQLFFWKKPRRKQMRAKTAVKHRPLSNMVKPKLSVAEGACVDPAAAVEQFQGQSGLRGRRVVL